MKRIILLILFSSLYIKCTVPYDGESRYVFNTTILDKNNNPIPYFKVSANFYNGDYFDTLTNFINFNEFDKVIESTTDINGNISLVFPFASDRENLSIKIGDTTYPDFEIINIQKINFVNYKLTELPFILYRFNEATLLLVNVLNTTQIKYVSKMELIGKQRETIKNYNAQQISSQISPIINSNYNPIINQNIILRYEITTVVNNQASVEIVEESITIQENQVLYEITL